MSEKTNKLEDVVQKTSNIEQSSKELQLSDIRSLSDIEQIAEVIANSSTYNTAFVKYKDDEDGKEIEYIDKSAIVTCMLVGKEIGLSPIESVMMGSRLDRQAITKVRVGENLGLAPMQALNHIYIWNANGRELVYTGINVVTKVLNDNNIDINIIEDGTKAVSLYFIAEKDSPSFEVEFDPETMFVLPKAVNTDADKAKLKANIESGKMPCKRIFSKRATVELTRDGKSIKRSYTLRDAVNAGLYPGIDDDGVEVKGKDNWSKYPADQLIKMCIMRCARLIASDKLNGLYEASEFSDKGIRVEGAFESGIGAEEISYEEVNVEEVNINE